MNKKDIELVYKIANDLDKNGFTSLAAMCDKVADEMLVAIARGVPKTNQPGTKVITPDDFIKGTAAPKSAPPKPSTFKTLKDWAKPTAGAAAVNLVGGVAGSLIGGSADGSASQKEHSAETGAMVGGLTADLALRARSLIKEGKALTKEIKALRQLAAAARDVATRNKIFGEITSKHLKLNNLIKGVPGGIAAVVGGEIGSYYLSEIGYELTGNPLVELAGSAIGYAGGAAAGAAAAKGVGTAATTLTGAGALGAAGVALAGALGLGLGNLIVKLNPDTGSFWGNLFYEVFGDKHQGFIDHLVDWLEQAQQKAKAKDVDGAIRYTSMTMSAINSFLVEDQKEKDLNKKLNRRQRDKLYSIATEIDKMVMGFPEELRNEYVARQKKLERAMMKNIKI